MGSNHEPKPRSGNGAAVHGDIIGREPAENPKRSVRINYAFDADAYEQLLVLADEIKVPIPRVVRRALEVYVMLWTYIGKGYDVVLAHPNGETYRIPGDLLK